MTLTPTTTKTILGAVAALLVGLAAALSLATPAMGASACGKTVLEDWYDNGRIDRLYPLHCYEDAIDLIPKDLLPYADAEEVISRALASALRGEVFQGGCDPSSDGTTDDCAGGSGGANGGSGGANGGSSDGGTGSEALPDVDTSSSSTSVPIPLLVLGGMSVALLAAGGLGYVSRRRQTVEALDEYDDTTL